NGHDECFTRTCSCDGESSPHSTEANRDETKAPTFISQDKTEEKSRGLRFISVGFGMKRRPRHLFPKIKQKRKVAFFSGCLMDTMFKPTNDATLKLLQYAGCEIVIPEAQNCCGALQGHSGERDESRKMAKRN